MYPLSLSAPRVLVGGDISFGACSNDPTFVLIGFIVTIEEQ
jgi:hypothetical protein